MPEVSNINRNMKPFPGLQRYHVLTWEPKLVCEGVTATVHDVSVPTEITNQLFNRLARDQQAFFDAANQKFVIQHIAFVHQSWAPRKHVEFSPLKYFSTVRMKQNRNDPRTLRNICICWMRSAPCTSTALWPITCRLPLTKQGMIESCTCVYKPTTTRKPSSMNYCC